MKNEYRGKRLPSDRYKSELRMEGMRSQLEWIKRQLEYATYSEKFHLRIKVERGDIYEIDWGINVNAEFSNRHFGVVLANSDESNPLVTVCPLESNHYGPHPKSDLDIGYIEGVGTGNTTLAVINQIRTIDKLRLYSKRAIGLKESDENNNEKCAKMRLETHKLNMIIEAYKKYLNGENLF